MVAISDSKIAIIGDIAKRYLLLTSSDRWRVASNISIMPERAAKGMNWAARFFIDIRGWLNGNG